MEEWPDTPFEESMLEAQTVVLCQTSELSDELLNIAACHGYSISDTIRDRWSRHKEHTCFRFDPSERKVTFASDTFYLNYFDTIADFDYTMCTFYGLSQLPEISSKEFESMLEVIQDEG